MNSVFFLPLLTKSRSGNIMMGIIKGRRRELCPFCFEYFMLRNTPFRCSSPMSICKPKVDKVLLEHWAETLPIGKVLPSPGRFVRSIYCSECGNLSRKRLCPHCHSELPHTIADEKAYIFAVIGAKDSGKSHYIAVLIEELKNRIGRQQNILLESIGDHTVKRFNEEFKNPVYIKHTIIRNTRSAVADRKIRQPLVYSLTITSRWLQRMFESGGILKKLGDTNFFCRLGRKSPILVFFDTAGEDLNSEDVMSTVNKYIYRSKGVVLLVDPLQLPKVRDLLGNKVDLPMIHTESSEIMTRTTRLIQLGINLKPEDRIPIPFAITFSKFDAVKPLIDAQFQLNSNARHDKGFDISDFQAVNSEMMALLEDWGEQNLVQQVLARYTKHGFFGVTALGCNPHGTNKVPRVLPRRVEDPFLWLLSENGLIRRERK